MLGWVSKIQLFKNWLYFLLNNLEEKNSDLHYSVYITTLKYWEIYFTTVQGLSLILTLCSSAQVLQPILR